MPDDLGIVNKVVAAGEAFVGEEKLQEIIRLLLLLHEWVAYVTDEGKE